MEQLNVYLTTEMLWKSYQMKNVNSKSSKDDNYCNSRWECVSLAYSQNNQYNANV